jgi:Fe-S-cluster containining protein
MKRALPSLFATIRDHLGLNVAGISLQLTRKIYVAGASVRNCNGRCCRGGTTVSVEERDRILEHAKIVAEAMTSRARRTPSRWFNRRVVRDDDFTAGRTTDTRVLDGACVFYRTDGLCALQVAASRRLGSPYSLKPAVCLLWPLCVQDRCLEAGYAWFTRRQECCAPVRSGAHTALQVIVPDEDLMAQMSRPGISRGGGPPSKRRPAGARHA